MNVIHDQLLIKQSYRWMKELWRPEQVTEPASPTADHGVLAYPTLLL